MGVLSLDAIENGLLSHGALCFLGDTCTTVNQMFMYTVQVMFQNFRLKHHLINFMQNTLTEKKYNYKLRNIERYWYFRKYVLYSGKFIR